MPTLRSVAVLLLAAATAVAQSPTPSPTDTLTGQPAVPPPPVGTPLVVDAPATEFEPAVWQIDVLVGAPLGVRVQRRLGDSRVWAEGGAGLYLVFPTAFAGVRYDGRVYEGRRHAVLIRPGADAALVYAWSLFGSKDTLAGMVVGDVDLVWRRLAVDGGALELGLKLGVGVPVTRGVRGVLPIAALIGGFSF